VIHKPSLCISEATACFGWGFEQIIVDQPTDRPAVTGCLSCWYKSQIPQSSSSQRCWRRLTRDKCCRVQGAHCCEESQDLQLSTQYITSQFFMHLLSSYCITQTLQQKLHYSTCFLVVLCNTNMDASYKIHTKYSTLH